MNQAPLIAPREGVVAKQPSLAREWRFLVTACIISGLLVWLGQGPITWVLALGLLSGTAVAVVRADLMHPFTWYIPVFCLYSTFYPILVGLERWREFGFLHKACGLEWLATVTFILIIGPARRPVVPPLKLLKSLAQPSLPVFWITAVVAVIFFWYLRQGGFVSKWEIGRSPSLIVGLGGPAFSVFTVAFAAILASGFASRRIPFVAIAATLLLSLAGVLIAGERDMILRVIVISVLLMHALYRRMKAREFTVLFLLGVFSVAVLAQMRNVMIVDKPRVFHFDDPTEQILGGEFVSAGWNLDGLIDEMEGEEFFWGETLWWDVKRVFIPGFMRYSTMTPGRWFNERRFPALVAYGGGRGFTIVGEGYMNFGAAGVVLWFIIIGFTLRRLYTLSSESPFWFLTYVVSTTLFLYVIREDFAHLLSQSLKHIVFPLLIIHAAQRVIDTIGLGQRRVPASAKAAGS